MYAQVIIKTINQSIDKIFEYNIPDEFQNISLGTRVKVPFGRGNKLIEGYIVGFCGNTDFDKNKIKSIDSICDSYPVFTPETIELAKWMKEKYYCTLTECLQCIMPSSKSLEMKSKVKYVKLVDIQTCDDYINKTRFEAQKKILNFLKLNSKVELKQLKSVLNISDSSIKTLNKNGLIEIVEEYRNEYSSFNLSLPLTLTPEQKFAVESIKEAINLEITKTFLLHGVTGSGKTEVYLQLIDIVLKKGKQAIVLVPEISLTPQTVSRFENRFGSIIALTHSKMSNSERITQWNRARTGEAKIMIGPRSAIFTPFENLGIIIIDEEHESTYKSETNPKYHAREVAQKRCELTNSVLVLGSATPSLETYYRTSNNDIVLIKMKQRAMNSQLPKINIVDMRQELADGNFNIFSQKLAQAIKNNLYKKEQTILFLNRRGHSTFISCRKCGYVAKCNDCNLPYTYHQDINRLSCHYCGKQIDILTICPECGSKYVKYFGIGTQKVENEIKRLFPEATVARMDTDTTTKRNSHALILKDFSNGKTDILIGTQMIAKGHDFPKVTLVGVIAADLSLNMDDFRAGEITFQLLTQVSGRAGRAELMGEVFIQTYNPESYVIALSKTQEYEKFYEQEIAMRQIMKYPPFSNIFIFVISGENEKSVIDGSYRLISVLNYYNRKGKFELLGPTPARVSKIRKLYRWKIIIKCDEEQRLKIYALYCLDKFKANGFYTNDVSIQLNMNPMVSL